MEAERIWWLLCDGGHSDVHQHYFLERNEEEARVDSQVLVLFIGQMRRKGRERRRGGQMRKCWRWENKPTAIYSPRSASASAASSVYSSRARPSSPCSCSTVAMLTMLA